jgi:hypothetical protein
VAPMILGGTSAPGAVAGRGWRLPEAIGLQSLVARPIGRDWLLEGDLRCAEEPA